MSKYILIYYWRFDEKSLIYEETTNVVSLIDRMDKDIETYPGIDKIELYELEHGRGVKQYHIKRVAEHDFKRWYNLEFNPEEVKP